MGRAFEPGRSNRIRRPRAYLARAHHSPHRAAAAAPAARLPLDSKRRSAAALTDGSAGSGAAGGAGGDAADEAAEDFVHLRVQRLPEPDGRTRRGAARDFKRRGAFVAFAARASRGRAPWTCRRDFGEADRSVRARTPAAVPAQVARWNLEKKGAADRVIVESRGVTDHYMKWGSPLEEPAIGALKKYHPHVSRPRGRSLCFARTTRAVRRGRNRRKRSSSRRRDSAEYPASRRRRD